MRWIALFVFLFGVSMAEANIVRQPDKTKRFFEEKKKKEKKDPVIAEDCEVIIDGKKAKLEDLKLGMNAVFTVEDGFIIRIVVITKKE